MAKFSPGAIISEIRGSVGNENYSRNRYGPIVRAKLTQPYSATALQVANRTRMQNAVSAWQALTDAERKAYSQFAMDHPFEDSLGQTKVYSGYTFFLKCYLNAYSVFDTPQPLIRINRYPLGYSLTGFIFHSGQWKVSKIPVEYQDDVYSTIYMTDILPTSITSPNPSVFNKIFSTVASDSSRVDFQTPWESYYSASFPTDPNQSIWFRIRAIDLLTGISSPSTQIKYTPS